MANEISIQFLAQYQQPMPDPGPMQPMNVLHTWLAAGSSGYYVPTDAALDSYPPAITLDQSGTNANDTTVSVGTSESDMPRGSVATVGWLFLQNLDATDYVTWGPKSGGVMIEFGRLNPGEFAALRLEPGVTVRWKASAGTCDVKMLLVED